MKSKYEISVWDDIISNDGQSFNEKKIIVIGSDTMTSEARARDPKLVTNIDGTNKFTFSMYYSYIDTHTGERVKNPYVQYLINERKIKVFWKDEWYDLLIKQIKEDQVQHVFSYTCEDAYITELSRTGFELTFATELQNNIGTAQELVEKVIENTDWRFDSNSDSIYQETEEAVYETTTILPNIVQGAVAKKAPLDQTIYIQKNKPLLVYYSQLQNLSNLNGTTSEIQVCYTDDTFKTDENDMVVINGECCTITVKWEVNETIVTTYVGSQKFFQLDIANGVSRRFRAKRYVQSQRMIYNDIVGRYVNVYNNGTLLGYNTTEFNDALSVVNIVTNPFNFKNFSGWHGKDLKFELYPKFDQTTVIAKYTATSYLYLPKDPDKANTYIYNSGIQNNRAYIPNGFIEGEKYILRFKIKKTLDGGYIGNPNNNDSPWSYLIPSIQSRNIDYEPTGTPYFIIQDKKITSDINKFNQPVYWLEYTFICNKSCPYDKILSTKSEDLFGIFLEVKTACWLEEIQFYRELYGLDGEGNTVRINPESLSLQSISQTVWKYFDADQPENVTKDSLVYRYTSLDEWVNAKPDYNNYQRYGTIEIDNSNRFNILQTIAETFECWVRFKIKHDQVTGYIERDDEGRLCKWIQLKNETGQETGIGFIYGIDLKSIVRNIKSDKISTKTIVEQNDNEFGKNGFCSIARSVQNYPRENFIYNFDYYIQHGFLDKNTLYNDLYNLTGYYYQLHSDNVEYANNVEALTNKKLELTKQTAMMTVYSQYISAADEEQNSILDSLKKLAGVDNENDAYAYAELHYNDTKVQSLIADRAQLATTILTYKKLSDELEQSLAALNKYISDRENRQKEIIDDLTRLNKWFQIKYARFIQEGTWSSEDYWNDDLYYLDALQVAYQSSRPQISYDINVLRISDLDEYSSKVFKLGDISFVQDTEYFGYKEDKITPYKERVVLTEITSYFDTPDKDTIKVQNYKSQFDDLFQRITATVQNLELTQGKYAKAANIVADDGTIRSSVIQNTFNSNKDLVYGAQNESATIDNTGITVVDNANASRQVKITSGGIFVTDDAGNTWKNAIRGDGISTDLLTAGKINTEQITVYNGDYPSFRWDPNGLNAYKFTDEGQVDTTQFVRFDQYGIYGIQNGPEVYIPSSDPTTRPEDKIYQDASFGLVWDKFFMKSGKGSTGIEISTDRDIVVTANGKDRIRIGRVDGKDTVSDYPSYGIRIYDNDDNTVFECGSFFNKATFEFEDKATIAGWHFTEEELSSSTFEGRTIRIKADGNIGCYGNPAERVSESVFTEVSGGGTVTTNGINVINSFYAVKLTDKGDSDPILINAGTRIFPFVSTIGANKTQRQVSGRIQQTYVAPSSEYTPEPSSTIQFSLNNETYKVSDLVWEVTSAKNTQNEQSQSFKDKGGKTTTYYYTTYTYTFNLTAKKSKNGSTYFRLNYQDSYPVKKIRYTPASNTTWCIRNNGDAVFHDIFADGGQIAGWWIDDTSIYQTYDGTSARVKKNGTSNIKTELSSSGTATKGGFDYSIITDAINASMASIGGVLMSSGLINGYSIASVANTAQYALEVAQTASSRANDAYEVANSCSRRGHTHTFNYNGNTGFGGNPSHSHYYEGGGTTGGGN